MTRINCVPVETLHDKHLTAEQHEITRVYRQAYEARFRAYPNDFVQPYKEYVLGTGHVTFFYDKLWYIAIRHAQIVNEMLDRGFKATIIEGHRVWLDIAKRESKYARLWNKWEPTQKAMFINQRRIDERLKDMGV